MTVMNRTTNLEIIIMMVVLVLCVGLLITIMFAETHESPTQAEIKLRNEIQAKWNEMIDAIRDGDDAKVEEISKWLDKNAGTSFEKLDDAQSKMICAWCGEIIRDSNTPQDSHGICSECKKTFFSPGE